MSSQSTSGIMSVEAPASTLQVPGMYQFGRNTKPAANAQAPSITPCVRQSFTASPGPLYTSSAGRYEGYSHLGRSTNTFSSSLAGGTPASRFSGAQTTTTGRYSPMSYSSNQFRCQQRGTYSQQSMYGDAHVISERTVEHEVRVPKKVVREDIVEKVIVVPEKVVHEEVVEDITTVRERIIEVAKTIYQERIVEVPETEYIERIVEVPETIYQEKIKEVPRIEYQERIIEVPKIITQERVVEVPEIQYVEVVVEKVVEVPEIREQVVLKQVPVVQYVERPVPEYVNVEVEQEVVRQIPVPVEAITTVYLHFPKIRSRYAKQDVPLYVPRFIEVAMPADFMDATAVAEAESYSQQVSVVSSQTAVSICEVERIAGALKDLDEHYINVSAQTTEDPSVHLCNAWSQGKLNVSNVANIPLDETKERELVEEPDTTVHSKSIESVADNESKETETLSNSCEEEKTGLRLRSLSSLSSHHSFEKNIKTMTSSSSSSSSKSGDDSCEKNKKKMGSLSSSSTSKSGAHTFEESVKKVFSAFASESRDSSKERRLSTDSSNSKSSKEAVPSLKPERLMNKATDESPTERRISHLSNNTPTKQTTPRAQQD